MDANEIITLVKDVFGQDPLSASSKIEVMQAKEATAYLLNKHLKMVAYTQESLFSVYHTSITTRIEKAKYNISKNRIFKKKIEIIENRILGIEEQPMPILYPNEVIELVRDIFKKDPLDKVKKVDSMSAKFGLCYLLKYGIKLDESQQSRLLGITHTSIMYRIQQAEDLMNWNPVFKKQITQLQAKIAA
jgi:hypothetical protein